MRFLLYERTYIRLRENRCRREPGTNGLIIPGSSLRINQIQSFTNTAGQLLTGFESGTAERGEK